jgi:hypothetical protein
MFCRICVPAWVLVALLLGSPLHAASKRTENVLVWSDKSVSEISAYVDEVDRYLQKGRYDRVDPRDRAWMIKAIAVIRAELPANSGLSEPSPELLSLTSDFETGMIGIEEGGIICRKARRTGSHMQTQRCFTKQRLAEDTVRSQDQLHKAARITPLKQPRSGNGPIPPGGGDLGATPGTL